VVVVVGSPLVDVVVGSASRTRSGQHGVVVVVGSPVVVVSVVVVASAQVLTGVGYQTMPS
jgi:hypothetical protein